MKTKESPHPQWATRFREKNTELRKINGKYYLYSIKSEYNKDRKRSVKKTLGILGSITQEQGFIPSDKKLLKEKVLEIPMSISRCLGFTIFFGHYLLKSLNHSTRYLTKTL
jgi:hypothetical protein